MNISSLQYSSLLYNQLPHVASILIDEHVGILKEIKEVPRFDGDPEFFHFSGRSCNTKAFSGEKNFRNTGGASMNKDIAKSKAIGEAIERYSSAIYDINELPLCTFNDAAFRAVNPSEFGLYLPEQYDQDGFLFAPFGPESPVRWCECVELLNEEKVFIPAASIYMPYFYYQGSGDTPILQPISTGMACHSTREKAIISAICEVLERDAVMITWQAMISPPQIRIETLSDNNYEIVKRLEHNGSKVFMFNITLDHGIPTILSVLKGGNNPYLPALIFAGAADPSPDKAAQKSLEELPHTRRYCSRLMEYSPNFETAFPHHLNVTDQAEHLHFYCDHDNSKYADFIFKSQKRIEFDQIEPIKGNSNKHTLDEIIKRIYQIGERIYVKDMTTADVSALGLHVIRTTIPGMQRLCMGYQNRCLGGKRLWEIPQKMGYKGITKDSLDNPAPHPYP